MQNRDGPVFLLDASRVVRAAALPASLAGIGFVCPLFTPANRRVAAAEAVGLGLRPAAAVIDPTAIVAASTSFDLGCYVNAGCILGAAGAIGRFVLINRGASLGHHATVADLVSIGPGATIAGQVSIGTAVLIGAGAVVAPGVRIGAGSVVGPGAVVTHDVPPDSLASGNPARVMPRPPTSGGR